MYDDRKKLEYRRRRFIARLERELPDMIASLEDGWLIAERVIGRRQLRDGVVAEFRLVATRPEYGDAVKKRASTPTPGIGPLNLREMEA